MACTIEVPSTVAAETTSALRPTKLFIGGISRNTTTKHLRDHFSQIGRVLDCVAMKNGEGQSRGFGYVTLDSATAAQKCLCEPQCIDNRIVDMKLAVPEGSGASPKSANFNMNMYSGYNTDLFGSFDYSEWPEATAAYGGGAFPWWPEDTSPTASQGLDCLDLLCSSRGGYSPHDLTPHSAGMSASFCFDDFADSGANTPCSKDSHETGLLLPPVLSSDAGNKTQQFTNHMSASAPEFVPQAAAAHEENHQAGAGKIKARTSSKNRAPLGEITNIVNSEDILKPFRSPSKGADAAVGTLNAVKGDDEAAKLEDSQTGEAEVAAEQKALLDGTEVSSESSEDADAAYGPAEDDQAEVDMNNLPSLGSAQHASGECKRCNFFAKGRCQNGKDCSFCHLPHEKRKLSRAEIRERRASFEATEMQAGPILPPGLTAPWQPEQEPLLSTRPMLPPMVQTYPGYIDHCAFQRLSSVPCTSAPLVLSTVPSPAASVASTPYATPVPTPTAASTKEARTMFPSAPSTAKSISEKEEDDTNRWSRTDLLQIREQLLKTGALKAESSTGRIRAESVNNTAAQ